jgi:hypothetical protein
LLAISEKLVEQQPHTFTLKFIHWVAKLSTQLQLWLQLMRAA